MTYSINGYPWGNVFFNIKAMNTPKKALIFFLLLVVILVGWLSVYSRSKKTISTPNQQNVQEGKTGTWEEIVGMSSWTTDDTSSWSIESQTWSTEPTGDGECDAIITNPRFQKTNLVKTYKKLVNISEIEELKAEYRAVKELPLKTYDLTDPYYAWNEEGLLFMNLYSNWNLSDIDAAYSSKKIDSWSYAKLKSFVTWKDECWDDQNCRISFNIFTSIKENRISFPTTLDMSHRMEFYVFNQNKPQEYLKNLQKLIVTECKKQLNK